jgi:hypothetical protein
MARKRFILEYWESIYGALSDQHKLDFLAHDKIEYIQCYKIDHIKDSLGKNKKLADALKYLEANYWPPERKYREYDSKSKKKSPRWTPWTDEPDYFEEVREFYDPDRD